MKSPLRLESPKFKVNMSQLNSDSTHLAAGESHIPLGGNRNREHHLKNENLRGSLSFYNFTTVAEMNKNEEKVFIPQSLKLNSTSSVHVDCTIATPGIFQINIP
jgi:hypothetical protein